MPEFGLAGPADLNQLDANLADGVIVAVALGLVDDDLILEAGQVWQLFDRPRFVASDTGGNGDDDASGCT